MAKVKSVRKPLKTVRRVSKKSSAPAFKLSSILPLIGIGIAILALVGLMVASNQKIKTNSKASGQTLTQQCQRLVADKARYQEEINYYKSFEKCDTNFGFKVGSYSGDPTFTCKERSKFSTSTVGEVCNPSKITEWNNLINGHYNTLANTYQQQIASNKNQIRGCNRVPACVEQYQPTLEICEANHAMVSKTIAELRTRHDVCKDCLDNKEAYKTAQSNFNNADGEYKAQKCDSILNPPACGEPCNKELKCSQDGVSQVCVKKINGNEQATRCSVDVPAIWQNCQRTGKKEDCCNMPTPTPYPGCGRQCSGEPPNGRCDDNENLVCVTHDGPQKHTCAKKGNQSIIDDCKNTKGGNCCNVPTNIPTATKAPTLTPTKTPIPTKSPTPTPKYVQECAAIQGGTCRGRCGLDEQVSTKGSCYSSSEKCCVWKGGGSHSAEYTWTQPDPSCTGTTYLYGCAGEGSSQKCQRVWYVDRCVEHANCGPCYK
ncbi:MAG TPA: hypothetical protein VK338_04165 [Candidatus Nitrosocosmicus sp.]|nr:hypothetical protein [Candidatus Nitrosocosmicus sp.]